MPEDDIAYQETNASPLVDEVFGGRLSTAEAIERLRNRLLDLTTRNRLLAYRFPKARCIPIVGAPNYNMALDRLLDGNQIRLMPAPEPPPDSFQGKKPDVRQFAEKHGILTSLDFPAAALGPHTGRRIHGLQVLLYPGDMDRHVRKIATEAKTAIEETGSNMLFLIVGYLEWYDSDESDKALLAPLLSLPVTLVKGPTDPVTRTYQWSVQHNGEDLTENATLKEKLKQFPLHLPEMEDDEEPEAFFQRIEEAIRNKRRWKVRRQLTIGMLSFGKLAVWADLDTVKNPAIAKNPQIENIFKGGEAVGDGQFFAEDYKVDEHPSGDIPVIYDADSSQHSAIIDVLAGKNLVVNGPPGTGKSQTITNVIAAALSRGKKVLFVAEKLAALEVVRHRLNHANLGHFCLELHSHKTQKKRFIEDIKERLAQTFVPPPQFNNHLATLRRHKLDLAQHMERMNSKIGNELDLTIEQVFWACERRRAKLGELAKAAEKIELADAQKWGLDDIRMRREQVEAMADLWTEVNAAGQPHPWDGFFPSAYVPGDNNSIARIVQEAEGHLEDLLSHSKELAALLGEAADVTVADRMVARDVLEDLQSPPGNLIAALLPAMFGASDRHGQRSSQAVKKLTDTLIQARGYRQASYEILRQDHGLDVEQVAALRQKVEPHFLPAAMDLPLEDFAAGADQLWGRLADFHAAANIGRFGWAKISDSLIPAVETALAGLGDLDAADIPFADLDSAAIAVGELQRALVHGLDAVGAVTARRSLPFDDRPASVGRLLEPGGIEGLLGDLPDDEEVRTAKSAIATIPMPLTASLSAIERAIERLRLLENSVKDSVQRCSEAAERFGLRGEGPTSPEEELRALITVAEKAPLDLLRHRRPGLADRSAGEAIAKAKHAIQRETEMRGQLDPVFHIDTAPPAADLKTALMAFRRGDGFFNFLNGDWRRAKKLYQSIAKERTKRSASELADTVGKLLAWQEHRDAFNANQSWPYIFGELFQGFDTEVGKAERLHQWHMESHTVLVGSVNLFGRIDLLSVDATWLESIATRGDAVKADVAQLEGCESALRDILGAHPQGFQSARRAGWPQAVQYIEQLRQTLVDALALFRRRGVMTLSPSRIVELMEARRDLEGLRTDIEALVGAPEALRAAGGSAFRRMLSAPDMHLRAILVQVGEAAAKAGQLCTLIREHADPASSVAAAKSFVEAKTALLQNVQALAPLGDAGQSQAAFATLAEWLAAVSRDVLNMFRDAVGAGCSVLDAFQAVTRLGLADNMVEELETAPETVRLFGPALNGYDTDEKAIADSWHWGSLVSKAPLTGDVRNLLLSPEAIGGLASCRALLGKMADCHKEAIESVGQLNRFGEIEAKDWLPATLTPATLLGKVTMALAATDAILPLSKWHAATDKCLHYGLGGFVDLLERNAVPPGALGAVFEYCAYTSIGKAICRAVPEVARFDGRAHNRLRDDYKALDRQIIELTGQACAWQIDASKNVPQGNRGGRVGQLSEMFLLQHQINLQRRHIPIRQLIRRAGRALQELKPCFMMGPLSVAQYLSMGALKFDLVVMDEASQLRPEDALGAIARGSQLVVVGDPKQLPPTNFFDRLGGSGDDEEDEDNASITHGMESILDICQQIYTPVRSLRWHYRSRHESLIAFSNHYFYKNLVVFPSPHAETQRLGVKWRYVRDGLYEERRNYPEAKRVVDAVVWHMRNCPDESLGVVTLNGTQRDLIEELLDHRFRQSDECRAYMEMWEEAGWPFFCKNLENVQGDERDCIFISTTFGRPKGATKVRQNFGPISRPDGWRRLNVLFTRAKNRLELFTSMQPEDIVIDEKSPLGTKALRDYLDYAKNGVLAQVEVTDREPDSDFEVAVADALRAKGYEVRPQLGVAGYFVDMAVRNPDRPGEWLAAIECDGATYHSGLSVRDRDRIRQDILESLGWKGRIHRIWSTDWFYDPLPEIAKLLAFLAKCRAESKQRDEVLPLELPWCGDSADFAVELGDEAPASAAAAEVVVADVDDAQALALLREDEAATPSSDVYVEVGDRVLYAFGDAPTEKHAVTIVDGQGNPRLELVNEEAPLAQALLGLSQGEDGEFVAPGGKKRFIRVLKIER